MRHGDSFIALREEQYETEPVLQHLIAEHPEILVGEGGGEGRDAWLLVKQEASIADEEEPGRRMTLDHLYLDQDAVPTFVEVKRSSDTRIRREVVGQMLDYAANAASYWNVDALRAWFAARCEQRAADPEDALREAFPGVQDTDAYWEASASVLPGATTPHVRRVSRAMQAHQTVRVPQVRAEVPRQSPRGLRQEAVQRRHAIRDAVLRTDDFVVLSGHVLDVRPKLLKVVSETCALGSLTNVYDH